MAKWEVYGVAQGTKYLGTVDADSKEEAEVKAGKLESHISLCHQCARQCEVEVQDIIVEKVS